MHNGGVSYEESKNNLLVQRRKQLGFSQQEIADKVGIDRSYYTKIENGLVPSVKVASTWSPFRF